MGGDEAERDDDDLESEVRSKLEANLLASQLAVEAEDNILTVTGTVPTQAQFNRIETLAKEIKGLYRLSYARVIARCQQIKQRN